jgi:hypothetical protein
MKFNAIKITGIITAVILLVGLGVFLGRFLGGSPQGPISANQQSNDSFLSRITPPSKPIPNPVIDNALTSLRRMSSATEVGINFREYSKRLIDLKFEVEEDIAKLPDSELKQQIQLCLQAYIDAATVWRESSGYDFIPTKFEPVKTLQKQYAIPNGKRNSIDVVLKDQALSKIWAAARKNLERSTELQIKQ